MPYGIPMRAKSALTKGPKKNPSRIAEAGALGAQVMSKEPYPPKKGGSAPKKHVKVVGKKGKGKKSPRDFRAAAFGGEKY